MAVEAAADGTPRGLLVRGRMRPVIAISDRWRIDDEWWRAEISRQYFAVEVAGGTRVTIFQDLVTGAWFSQRYTAPVRLEAG